MFINNLKLGSRARLKKSAPKIASAFGS